jgi:Xaa-Pro dipeptidase
MLERMTDFAERQARLRALKGLDAVVLVPGANLRYFTGLDFHLSERPLLAIVSAAGLALVLPELEVPQLAARPELAARVFSWSDEAGYEGAFRAALRDLELLDQVVGIDSMTMRAGEYLALLAEAPDLQLRRAEGALMALRARKEPDELAAIRAAVALSERALERLLPELSAGQSEGQIAERLGELLGEEGSEGHAFAPLVQSGPNSALPHGAPSARQLGPGEPLLIDYGGRKGGYPADITRTLFVGEPTPELAHIFELVSAANHAAVAAVAPGVAMQEVDRAARRVIQEAGYGAQFIHRTGHGLGLEVHESVPQLAEGVVAPLEPGMVMTIEPGIYLPGVGGVRLEDVVVVTATGAEVLTRLPHELVSGR